MACGDGVTADKLKLPVPLKNFLSGGVGGMCMVLAGHPFDTIKVRLQVANVSQNPKAYVGAFDCVKKTFAHEGIRGFFKGMTTPLLTVTPQQALGFFGYGVGKNIVSYLSPKSKHNEEKNSSLSPPRLFLAGAISALFTTFVITPSERIKCLLQIQGQNTSSTIPPKYKGPFHCGATLLREGGVRNLYQGMGASLMKGIPLAGIKFMTFDVLKFHLSGGKLPLSPAKTILAGGLTGIIIWIFVLPLDVVKSRVQTAPKGLYPRGVRDALPQLLKTEGPQGLYRGAVPVFIRAFPAQAACFTGFEMTMRVFNALEI